MFTVLFYQPLYNGLIALINILPWEDAGFAVIVFTILIKLILFPLSKKSVVTQFRLKQLAPEIEKIKKTYTDKQEQSRQMLQLYKTNKINPFLSIIRDRSVYWQHWSHLSTFLLTFLTPPSSLCYANPYYAGRNYNP